MKKLKLKSLFPSCLGLGVLGLLMSGCASEDKIYKVVDKYMAEKGVEVVEGALEEIVEKRKNKQKGPSLEERMKNRVDVSIENAPVKGAKDAEITIVEFSDFECPFCGRVLPTLEKVMKEYKGQVKLAFRHNPLPFHKKAPMAHKAAMAAQEQGKFWEYHDLVFKNQRQISEENLVKWAKEVGLDIEKFNKDRKKSEYEKRMKADQQFARSNGAGGTPGFFINGVRLVGAQPFPKFKEVIDLLLAEKS